MKKSRAWINSMRLRTLPLACSSIITGSAIAYHHSSNFWTIFFLSLLTAILLQILSNLANDYGDFVHGADNDERLGPARQLQSGTITKSAMKNAIILLALASFGSGILLLYYSFGSQFFTWKPILFVALGLGAIAAAINYTAGKNPYGYRALGDLFVFIFFGIIGVCGTYFLHVSYFNFEILPPAIAIGLFSVAVLNLNNMRDIENDRNSGKITLVVKMGIEHAKTYHASLIIIGWIAVTAFFMTHHGNPLLLVLYLPGFIFYKNLKVVFEHEDSSSLDPELKKIALGTLALSILFFITQILSF